MPDIDHDTLDAHAFADACEAAPDVDANQLRRVIDRYMAGLHIQVHAVHAEHELSSAEADALFRRAATASIDVEF